jgi:ABC-2 type transport system ATP-binding protein
VRETRDTGCAVIVTTHSFEEAERLADHIVIVNQGRVVAHGSLAELTAERSLEDVYFSLTRETAR